MTDIHVMIDIETLGTGLESVITQISAIPFDRERVYIRERFDTYLDINAQQDAYRVVEHGTLQWWLSQSDEARERLQEGLKNAVHPGAALYEMRNWPSMHGRSGWTGFAGIWSKGPAFDLAMIDHLSIEFADNSPFMGCFRNYRDVRTMQDFVTDEQKQEINQGISALIPGGAHDAVWDCVYQAKLVQAAWRTIGGTNTGNIGLVKGSTDVTLEIPQFLSQSLEERHDLV